MSRRFQIQIILLAVVVGLPFVPGADAYLRSAIQAANYTVIAASLVMLTGWVGQISLGHAALVGIGAYATGFATGQLGLIFPLSLPVAALVSGVVAALLGVIALRVRGLYLAVATLIFSWAASEFLFRQDWVLAYSSIDSQAVGSQGTLLHLDFSSTRVFYYVACAAAIAVLFALTNLRDSKTGRAFFAVRGSEMAAASLGMDVLRYKALAFGLSGALAGVAGNLLMTNARVVSPEAFDFNSSLLFLAIAVVGGLSSLGGAVAASVLFAAMAELFFRVEFLNAFLQLVSAALLAIVFRLYPGGLAGMGRRLVELGQVLRGWMEDLPDRIRDSAARQAEGAAADGAAVTAQLSAVEDVEDELTGRIARYVKRFVFQPFASGLRLATRPASALALRLLTEGPERPIAEGPLEFDHLHDDLEGAGQQTAAAAPSTNGSGPSRDADAASGESMAARLRDRELRPVHLPRREDRRTLIEADHVTVRFGGLTAVNDASLTVREGEIVGLIGPNGAGKTTLFNSIAGFNEPTEGRVHLYGQDVTRLTVHQRAQLGLARTFQLIQLFPQLTVFENLLSATHLQNPTGFIQHMAVTPQSIAAEEAARARVDRVIELLDLEDVADTRIAGIPFGILRMVEVARSLVTGARVIMLDEPASGLDERETDRLTEVLRFVRSLGATLLLIEHDVRMVTSVSDYIYVLERGAIIADGTPAKIQSDPAVIGAYLGEPAQNDEPAEDTEPAREEVVH